MTVLQILWSYTNNLQNSAQEWEKNTVTEFLEYRKGIIQNCSYIQIAISLAAVFLCAADLRTREQCCVSFLQL
jgi:hypothetical protein